MYRGIAYTPAAVAALAIVVTAAPTRAAADAAATGGRGESIRALDLGEVDEVPADLFRPAPIASAPPPPEPQETPVVVPLPPAVGPGLAGLATLAAMRVGRRAYRRR
jgi:hypothetical protein